jgi:serine/threonine-protein kinase HipA
MTAKHTARLRVLHCGVLIGTLAQIDRYRISFEYSHDWLQHGFDIAPRSLAFNESPQLAKEDLFFGLHGIFNDSLPDGWGLLLMDRAFMDKFGWGRSEITPLDRLAYIGSRGMGALEYQPEPIHRS